MKRCRITVEEAQTHEVAADRADLFVIVEGASLFTGQEALKKAREVAQLTADLQAFGLPADALYLQGVSADVQSGTLAKTSRARYRLRIRCTDLSKLGDYVGIIAAQKNTSLTSIEWGYPDTAVLQEASLLECIARANQKIAKIATALGVRVAGVAAFAEIVSDSEAHGRDRGVPSESQAMMHRGRMTADDLGLEVSHTKTLTVSVEIQYYVSAYEAGQ